MYVCMYEECKKGDAETECVRDLKEENKETKCESEHFTKEEIGYL